MKNVRISNKERGLIKGAVRRVFSRSELRQQAIKLTEINYTDPLRPRVKKWCRCKLCGNATPRYKMQCDHILPVVKLGMLLEDMSWDELVNNLWCDPNNLQGICETCHLEKSRSEAAERAKLRKAKKKGSTK